MGKRELLLVIGFLIVGVVVYHATAPPPGPNERTLSLSRFIEGARREIGGNRSNTETTSTTTADVDPTINEIRVVAGLSELQVTGEDRDDIEAALRVHSAAYTADEAKKYANETTLVVDRAASSLIYRVRYPQGRDTGRQRAFLTLKVPARMQMRIESGPNKMAIAKVASVEVPNGRGEIAIKDVTGRIVVTQRGGSTVVERAGMLKFTGRGAELTMTGVRGEAAVVLEHGGNLKGSQLGGPIDVIARDIDVTLEGLEKTRGPVRVNAFNGSVHLSGVETDTRVDGRESDIELTMSNAAPLAIYNDSANVTLTVPAAGFRLDAVVTDGRVQPDEILKELGLKPSVEEEIKETRVSGPVKGGGPLISVRATRGDLTLRTLESSTTAGTK